MIQQFPKEICRLDSLVVLDLSHNRVAIVPTEIGLLGSLQVLNLNHNRFVSLGCLAQANWSILRLAELPEQVLAIPLAIDYSYQD